ncbi:MAG: transposase [Gammaproteobacteria bacterium]|nr:transposase [Gammaproteobacteria bacterium]
MHLSIASISRVWDKKTPADTGRPVYHPSTILKLLVYGHSNRVQSSRRLEREAGRRVELMWLPGRLTPGLKTIADFRMTGSHGRMDTHMVVFTQHGHLTAIDETPFKFGFSP